MRIFFPALRYKFVKKNDMRLLFIFLLSSPFMLCYSQQEPLNQLDPSGKKDGKWIVYLDDKWNKTDSSKAVFYRFTWYDHGVNIHPMGAGGGKNSRMEASGALQQAGNIILLDGEYKWYDSKGRLKYIHVLKNGEYVAYKEFYSSGELQAYFDYTRHCEGQPHSWRMYVYDKQGKVISSSYTCKVNGKWPVLRD